MLLLKSSRQSHEDVVPQSAERILDAPDLVDGYYLNLMDWGRSNILSIALRNTVYLWDASNGSTSELVTVDEDVGPVTSVSWEAHCRWPELLRGSIVGLKPFSD